MDGCYEIELLCNPGLDCCVGSGDFFVGGWGDWPMSGAAWFWAVDELPPGGEGMPRTKVAPGLGFPTGWQHPADVTEAWARCKSMGIGACVAGVCQPTAVAPGTWGGVKSLFR